MNLLFIVYSNAVDDEMVEIARRTAGGYTRFSGVHGEGEGEPHLGTHIWPGVNNCIMAAVDRKRETAFAEEIRALRERFPGVGIRVFTIPLKDMY
ncbi:MAG: hypothetical protein KBA15_01340 [Spirochaetes bacterium]|jgi:hypothetical protein|nr:hypothetical protein [Spirochaetota bacterium]